MTSRDPDLCSPSQTTEMELIGVQTLRVMFGWDGTPSSHEWV